MINVNAGEIQRKTSVSKKAYDKQQFSLFGNIIGFIFQLTLVVFNVVIDNLPFTYWLCSFFAVVMLYLSIRSYKQYRQAKSNYLQCLREIELYHENMLMQQIAIFNKNLEKLENGDFKLPEVKDEVEN